MHPEQIKAALRMKGVKAASLADELKVADSSISQVIRGRAVSARIRGRISEITGIAVEVLWPSGQAMDSPGRSSGRALR